MRAGDDAVFADVGRRHGGPGRSIRRPTEHPLSLSIRSTCRQEITACGETSALSALLQIPCC